MNRGARVKDAGGRKFDMSIAGDCSFEFGGGLDQSIDRVKPTGNGVAQALLARRRFDS